MVIGLLKRFSCMIFFYFLHFFISYLHALHVDAESMTVRTQAISIISAYIFDFMARTFFRREDLSIFIDHMINCSMRPLSFTLVATNSEKWVAHVMGVLKLFCALLCVILCPFWFCNQLDLEGRAGYFG